jgi:phage tail sheath gpL-like
MVGSAPASTNNLINSGEAAAAAVRNAVFPSASLALTSAPASRSSRTISAEPVSTAAIRGVTPSSSGRLTARFLPFSNLLTA